MGDEKDQQCLAGPGGGERCGNWWCSFWLKSYSTPWAKGCFLEEGQYHKVHVARTSSHWPLCRYLCYREGLHVSTEASSFCWMRDWNRLFQKITTWRCGVVRKTNLNEVLAIVSDPSLQTVAKILVLVIDCIGARRRINYGIPRGLCPTQSFPAHITNFLSTHFRDPSLYDMGKTLSLSQWSENLQRQFYAMDVDSWLSVACRRAGVTFKKLVTRHWQAGPGTLAKKVGQGMIGWYNGCLVYPGLFHRHNTMLTHGEHIMGISRETFLIWPSHLHEKVLNKDSAKRDVWVNPPRSVLWVTSRIVNIFLGQGLRVRVCEECAQNSCAVLPHSFPGWTSQVLVSPNFGHPSFTKHRCWWRIVLRLP